MIYIIINKNEVEPMQNKKQKTIEKTFLFILSFSFFFCCYFRIDSRYRIDLNYILEFLLSDEKIILNANVAESPQSTADKFNRIWLQFNFVNKTKQNIFHNLTSWFFLRHWAQCYSLWSNNWKIQSNWWHQSRTYFFTNDKQTWMYFKAHFYLFFSSNLFSFFTFKIFDNKDNYNIILIVELPIFFSLRRKCHNSLQNHDVLCDLRRNW